MFGIAPSPTPYPTAPPSAPYPTAPPFSGLPFFLRLKLILVMMVVCPASNIHFFL